MILSQLILKGLSACECLKHEHHGTQTPDPRTPKKNSSGSDLDKNWTHSDVKSVAVRNLIVDDCLDVNRLQLELDGDVNQPEPKKQNHVTKTKLGKLTMQTVGFSDQPLLSHTSRLCVCRPDKWLVKERHQIHKCRDKLVNAEQTRRWQKNEALLVELESEVPVAAAELLHRNGQRVQSDAICRPSRGD